MAIQVLIQAVSTAGGASARKALSKCAQAVGMTGFEFFLRVVSCCMKLFPRVFRGEGVRSVKMQLLPIAAIRETLLAEGVVESETDALVYAVAFAFASMESERAFKEVAEKGSLSDIKGAFERTLHSVGRHQRISPMKLTEHSLSFRYLHCEFMRAFRELGVPTATVGKAFCDADRTFWKDSLNRNGRLFIIIKPMATQANSSESCSLGIAVKE